MRHARVTRKIKAALKMRGRGVAVVAVGASLSLLAGSGVLALSSDSVVSEDNDIQSSEFDSSHDIVGKVVPRDLFYGPAGCGRVGYSDGPIPAAMSEASLNLNEHRMRAIEASDIVCLRNDGDETVELAVSFANVLESEVAYTDAEAEQGDESPEVGELAQFLVAQLDSAGRPFPEDSSLDGAVYSSSCKRLEIVVARQFADWVNAPRVMDVDLAPGEVCPLQFHMRREDRMSEAEKAIAQTDKVQWDIVFTGRDVTEG